QHDAGMLLCLCSKNDADDVHEVFGCQAGMPLQRKHIVSRRIIWQPKSENVRALAAELNLSLDSFIFIDDNPAECAEVAARCPGVLSVNIPGGSVEIAASFRRHWAFDHLRTTAEDRERTTLYRQAVERESLRRTPTSLAEFIQALEVRVE